MAAVLLDDAALSCLFQPRYMDITLSARLESVSKTFLSHGHHFCKQVRRFDFKDRLLKEKTRKLAKKLAVRCPNLRKVLNISVNNDNLEEKIVTMGFINKMPNVSVVSINFEHFSQDILLPLAESASLAILEITSTLADADFTFDEKAVEKLNVTSLKCDRLSLINFCSPDSLETFHLNLHRPTSVDELIQKLKHYRRLRNVSVEFHFFDETEEVLKILEYARDFGKVAQLSYENDEIEFADDFQEMLQDHGFRANLHHFSLYLDDCIEIYDMDEFIASILDLSELTSLTLFRMEAIETSIFLNGLQNLKRLEITSTFDISPSCEGIMVNVRTLFDR